MRSSICFANTVACSPGARVLFQREGNLSFGKLRTSSFASRALPSLAAILRTRGISTVVVRELPKLETRVRFPYPAPSGCARSGAAPRFRLHGCGSASLGDARTTCARHSVCQCKVDQWGNKSDAYPSLHRPHRRSLACHAPVFHFFPPKAYETFLLRYEGPLGSAGRPARGAGDGPFLFHRSQRRGRRRDGHRHHQSGPAADPPRRHDPLRGRHRKHEQRNRDGGNDHGSRSCEHGLQSGAHRRALRAAGEQCRLSQYHARAA